MPDEHKPLNDLDFNMQMTQPVWGKKAGIGFMQRMGEVTKGDKIAELLSREVEEGKISLEDAQELLQKIVSEMSSEEDTLWNVLGFYTQDLRLANLDKDEIHYCKEYLNFSGDCLQMGLKGSFLLIIERVATTTEISQSKQGFLRRRMGTLTNENISNDIEPKRKNIFGMSKKE